MRIKRSVISISYGELFAWKRPSISHLNTWIYIEGGVLYT